MTLKSQYMSVAERRQQLRLWYHTPLGEWLAEQEQQQLEALLANVFGYYIVQIGCPGWEHNPLADSRIRHHILLDPDNTAPHPPQIQADPMALPLAPDSVDVAVLPHTLEYHPNPHEVLREAERVLIPEGRLLIVSFNPWSLWGIRRCMSRNGSPPWHGEFISPYRLRDWLALLGFDIEHQQGLIFSPPIRRRSWLERLQWMERAGKRFWPALAGVQIIVARKRVSTLTPIKPRWRPQRALGGRRITEPTTRLKDSAKRL